MELRRKVPQPTCVCCSTAHLSARLRVRVTAEKGAQACMRVLSWPIARTRMHARIDILRFPGHHAYARITYMFASHIERVWSWATAHTRMHRFPGHHAYVRIVTHMAKADADLAAGVPSCQCLRTRTHNTHACTRTRALGDAQTLRPTHQRESQVTHTGHSQAPSISDSSLQAVEYRSRLLNSKFCLIAKGHQVCVPHSPHQCRRGCPPRVCARTEHVCAHTQPCLHART